MTDEEDSAGICLRGQVRRELFALGFVIGEADFDQVGVTEGFLEQIGDALVHAGLADEHLRIERLREAAQFAAFGAGEAGLVFGA